MDLEGQFGDHARLAGHPRRSSFNRACPMVAFLGRAVVDAQRHRVLPADFHHRSVASFGPRDLGRVPRGALDHPPICVAELSGRRKLDPLQRPATAQLFHHGVYCRAGFDSDRSHAESGNFEQAGLARDRAESAGGPFHPLYLVLLVCAVHSGAWDHGVRHRSEGEHEPHVRGSGEPRMGWFSAVRLRPWCW